MTEPETIEWVIEVLNLLKSHFNTQIGQIKYGIARIDEVIDVIEKETKYGRQGE